MYAILSRIRKRRHWKSPTAIIVLAVVIDRGTRNIYLPTMILILLLNSARVKQIYTQVPPSSSSSLLLLVSVAVQVTACASEEQGDTREVPVDLTWPYLQWQHQTSFFLIEVRTTVMMMMMKKMPCTQRCAFAACHVVLCTLCSVHCMRLPWASYMDLRSP